MYTLILKFVANDLQEMCHDHYMVEESAAHLGAISTTTYKDEKNNCFIQIQSWPSKTFYDSIINLKEWSFTDHAKEKVGAKMIALQQKMKTVYKMEVLHELDLILG